MNKLMTKESGNYSLPVAQTTVRHQSI